MTSSAISAQGSTLQVATGTGAAKTATAIQVGFPTIITCAAHGFSNGDNIALAGFTGADAALLNGKSVTAKNVTGSTYAFDIDTTGKTITVGANTMTPTTYTQVNNVRTFTGFDGEASEIDVTNLSSLAKEYRLGLVDPGKFSIEVDQDDNDAGQLAVRASQIAGTLKGYKLTLPNGKVASYTAFCKKFSSSGGVDQVVKGQVDFRISGAITWA
jgi:hypothetical protein